MEKRRYYNFFKSDGRSFMMAFDHAGCHAIYPDPKKTIKAAIEGGLDGILANYGLVSQYRDILGDLGVIVRADHNSSDLCDGRDDWRLFLDGKSVAYLGGDGMMCFGLAGAEKAEYDRRTYENLSTIVSQCNEYGLVSAGEIMARGIINFEKATLEDLGLACRIACERGVDFIKAPYFGTPEQYHEQVVKHCYRPICILGGAVMPERDALQMIRNALDAGCKGVVMGKNAFTRDNVTRFCAAIAKLIHEDCSVDQAMKELK